MDQVPQGIVFPPRVSSQEKPAGQGPNLTHSSHTETLDPTSNNSVHPQHIPSPHHTADQYLDQQQQHHLLPPTSTARQAPPAQSPFSDNEGPASQIRSPPPEPSDGSDSDEVMLPPNWSATTNSKGRLYYYNIVTKETSWKLPSVNSSPSTHSDPFSSQRNEHQMEVLDQDYGSATEEPLPEGWNSAQDDDGSQYFFNASTGETTWNRPPSPEVLRNQLQSPRPSESSDGPFDSSPALSTSGKAQGVMSPTIPRATPKRQSSADDNMLQSQLLGLSLSEEELHALQLNQLPVEGIQRKGSLRVKSQKVSTNATISSWKDYWVVVYKGFLLFYRDDSGAIKNVHSLKASTESLHKLRQATQVKPSGCFDLEKVAVDLPTNGQALTKKKNYFYITPGTSVRLLLQDPSGGDEKIWIKDIGTSLASRKSEELSGVEDSYIIQVLKRQTSGGSESSNLKMNKRIEEKDLKTSSKNPLKLEKGRGIRSMVAHGIHVPRRKSAQDEKLPEEEEAFFDATQLDQQQQQQPQQQRQSATHRAFTDPKRRSNRDSPKEHGASGEGYGEPLRDAGSPGSGSHGSHGSHQGAKAKLTNMSRSFFSKDKDKEKEKDKDKEKEKEKVKDKPKDRIKDKYKDKDVKKESAAFKSAQGVFGGSLTVESGRTVPKVVELCVKSIEARGLATAGIYREPDVNTIAALLKLYFRELREPLMLFDFYPSFIAAADITDYNEKLYTIKSLVHSLPEANFNTLQYLMLHLSRVQDQYQTTKMDSANLAICFAPNLLRQEVDDLTSIINTGKQSSIIDTLIEQQEWVFDPYPEEDDETDEQQQEEEVHHAATKVPTEAADEEYEVVGGESDGVRSRELELKTGADDQDAHFQQQLLQDQQDEIYRQRKQEHRQDEQLFEKNDLQGHYDQKQHPFHSSETDVVPVPATATTTTTTTTATITTAAPISSPPAYTDQREGKNTSGSNDPFLHK
ncbi:hypothetical protein BGX30_006403 [Mortierella sp. GBA39]|nr:hypothetical protein BGX30_006403 [Mortierella sp. GBA39]